LEQTHEEGLSCARVGGWLVRHRRFMGGARKAQYQSKLSLVVDVECCTAPRPSLTLKGSREKYEQAASRLEAALRDLFSHEQQSTFTLRVNGNTPFYASGRLLWRPTHREAP
jgi:hypothetical protein